MALRPTYAIGIDLGTSNCALAYIDLRTPGAVERILEVPQYQTGDRMFSDDLLPSYIYYPVNNAPDAAKKITGFHARSIAAEQPQRVVHSAKSWLCHRGIDRESKLLPWQSEDIHHDEKYSPVEASAQFLSYLRDIWNRTMAVKDPLLSFNNQQIVITVPASFDQDAQRLTLDAARKAGYPRSVRLLEEPQAAFHAWLGGHPENDALRTALGITDTDITCHALVCDVGGGTTDLTLFALTFSEGQPPQIERIAVSEHILLGGDNIDITLAHILENRLSRDNESVSYMFRQRLVNRCRELKEKALATDSAERSGTYTVSYTEDHESLFADTREATINRDEIITTIHDGFFPFCEFDESLSVPSGGLRETGLPYAADPAVTHHIARFLQGRPTVDMLLFNGGTFTAPSLRQRITEQIARWQNGRQPVVLENNEPYFTVARGAARFGREIALGMSQLIHAGSSHGFYLQVNPQQNREKTYLVCMLPMGTDVETPCHVRKIDLHLLVNQPVEFKLYSTVKRSGDHIGQIIKCNDNEFYRLPPLHTVARLDAGGRKLYSDTVPVELETRLNAVGLLQVALISAKKVIVPAQRWRLEFNIRAMEDQGENDADVPSPLPETVREEAYRLLESDFDTTVFKRLETIAGSRRNTWSPTWLREFWKPLSETISRRQKGDAYELAWLNAAGFFLRPGFGVTLDDFRIDQLWNIHELGLEYGSLKTIREQWYIMWRRVSGGLDASRQCILYDEVRELLKSNVKQAAEAFRMAASFELLSVDRKKELFTILTEGITGKRPSLRPPYLWSLGRLLGRVSLYGGEQTVLPPSYVEECFSKMENWNWAESGMEYAVTMFALASRKTGRKELDISQNVRDAIVEKMQSTGIREELLRIVIQVVPVETTDYTAIYGEKLPIGISIREFS